MSKTAVITGRIGTETASQLDRLAERLDRSRAWLVARAVEQFVASETELLDSLDEAERQIDSGDFYTHEQMTSWAAGLRAGRDS